MEAGLSLVIVCVDLPIVVLALNTKGFFAVAATSHTLCLSGFYVEISKVTTELEGPVF